MERITHLGVLCALAALGAVFGSQSLQAQFGHGYGHYDYRLHRNYDHAQRDYGEAVNHYLRDQHQNLDHRQQDLYFYGTTNPFSSPRHYFYDVRQQGNHYRYDLHRNYDHYARDLRGGPYHYPRPHRRVFRH